MSASDNPRKRGIPTLPREAPSKRLKKLASTGWANLRSPTVEVSAYLITSWG